MKVKICGLKDADSLKAAVDAGADFIGLVFYPHSPRNIGIEDAAKLAAKMPAHVLSTALFVDPDDDEINDVLSQLQINVIQLHGSETPERVAAIKRKFGRPVMKAIGIRNADDLKDLNAFEAETDWLLFDARPENVLLPGGTGQSFDWSILKGKTFKKPWMLSGGLTAGNISEALAVLKPDAVDVSSGVEIARGQKSPDKIREFIAAAKS